MRGMDRFVFFASPSGAIDAKKAAAVLRELGGEVVSTSLGTVVLDAAPDLLKKAAKMLPGWRYTTHKTYPKPVPSKVKTSTRRRLPEAA